MENSNASLMNCSIVRRGLCFRHSSLFQYAFVVLHATKIYNRPLLFFELTHVKHLLAMTESVYSLYRSTRYCKVYELPNPFFFMRAVS